MNALKILQDAFESVNLEVEVTQEDYGGGYFCVVVKDENVDWLELTVTDVRGEIGENIEHQKPQTDIPGAIEFLKTHSPGTRLPDSYGV